MHPVPAPEITRPSCIRRCIWCTHYGTCLVDHAIKEGWNGFSCDVCTSFQPGGLDAGTIWEDYHRCGALLFTVENLEALPRIEPGIIGGYLEEEERRDTEWKHARSSPPRK